MGNPPGWTRRHSPETPVLDGYPSGESLLSFSALFCGQEGVVSFSGNSILPLPRGRDSIGPGTVHPDVQCDQIPFDLFSYLRENRSLSGRDLCPGGCGAREKSVDPDDPRSSAQAEATDSLRSDGDSLWPEGRVAEKRRGPNRDAPLCEWEGRCHPFYGTDHGGDQPAEPVTPSVNRLLMPRVRSRLEPEKAVTSYELRVHAAGHDRF